MDENFLLKTPLARRLYHERTEGLPIIDYHNHLDVKRLAENRPFEDLAELWLLNDPYKHRAMRIWGVEERYITGNAGNLDKFRSWMAVLPKLVGNPLYDWSILEMYRVFEIKLKPGETDPDRLWNEAGEKLAGQDFAPREIMKRFSVEYASPCASVMDVLGPFKVTENVAPSLRADDLLHLDHSVLSRLESETGRPITSLKGLFSALHDRLDAFAAAGCLFSDHALDNGFHYRRSDGKNDRRLISMAAGAVLTREDEEYLASEILRYLASEYAERNWTMLLHMGAQRYTSSRLRHLTGPAGGFAGIGSPWDAGGLAEMLDDFERGAGGLPRTVLFNLNPADNAMLAVLSGSYSQDKAVGKVQLGPAWWWNDHLLGMRQQLDAVSAYGVLSTFLGMTTDSRSLLSFSRHEYFRRALCGWMGDKAAAGEFPDDMDILGGIVEAVSYQNVKQIIDQGRRKT